MSNTRRAVVLVVEDDWLLRDTLAEQLRGAGCDVHEAATAEGALALLDQAPIDVLVTDISLGGYLNGWDVAEAFRRVRPALRIVYASGNSVEPCRQVTNSLFVSKPYDPQVILNICRDLS